MWLCDLWKGTKSAFPEACRERILNPHVPKLYLSAYAFGNMLSFKLFTSFKRLSEYPYNHTKDTALKQHCRISNATLVLQKVKWQEKVKKKNCHKSPRKKISKTSPEQTRKTGTRLTHVPRSERVASLLDKHCLVNN